MDKKKIKIAVTGASGFIGGHFTKASQHLFDFISLSHHETFEQIQRKLTTYRPDLVLHLGTYYTQDHKVADIETLISSNIKWPNLLLEASSRSNISCLINIESYWQNFQQEAGPANLYAATKNAFAEILKFYSNRFQMKVYNLTLYDVFGPEDNRGKIISLLLDACVKQKTIETTAAQQVINLTYIDDVISGLQKSVDLILNEKQKVFKNFEVCHSKEFPLIEVIKLITEFTGNSASILVGKKPYPQNIQMQPKHFYPTLPEWRAKISLESGIKNCIYAYK